MGDAPMNADAPDAGAAAGAGAGAAARAGTRLIFEPPSDEEAPTDTAVFRGPPRPPAVDTAPLQTSPELLDFWGALWHVDIEKDHGSDYDRDTINRSIIPNPRLSTDIFNAKAAYHQGAIIARNIGDKDSLFNMLFTLPEGLSELKAYQYFHTLTPESEGQVNINYSVHGPSKYSYKCFKRNPKLNGDTALNTSMNTFMGIGPESKVIRYTDTTIYGSALLMLSDSIIQAHSGPIEMDPAGKMNPESVNPGSREQFKQKFYVEHVTEQNIIEYPAFDHENINPLSFLYCKKPVTIHNMGVNNFGKYTLTTNFVYQQEVRTILGKPEPIMINFSSRDNIAGNLKKLNDDEKRVRGIKSRDMREGLFIAKHAGDILQANEQYRDTLLVKSSFLTPETRNNPVVEGENVINTGKYKKMIETYDLNLATKAATMDADYIQLHNQFDDTFIIFKNSKFDDPQIRINNLIARVSYETDELDKYKIEYIKEVDRINEQLLFFQGYLKGFFIEPYDINDIGLIEGVSRSAARVDRGKKDSTALSSQSKKYINIDTKLEMLSDKAYNDMYSANTGTYASLYERGKLRGSIDIAIYKNLNDEDINTRYRFLIKKALTLAILSTYLPNKVLQPQVGDAGGSGGAGGGGAGGGGGRGVPRRGGHPGRCGHHRLWGRACRCLRA
jgi:hypothetical protein